MRTKTCLRHTVADKRGRSNTISMTCLPFLFPRKCAFSYLRSKTTGSPPFLAHTHEAFESTKRPSTAPNARRGFASSTGIVPRRTLTVICGGTRAAKRSISAETGPKPAFGKRSLLEAATHRGNRCLHVHLAAKKDFIRLPAKRSTSAFSWPRQFCSWQLLMGEKQRFVSYVIVQVRSRDMRSPPVGNNRLWNLNRPCYLNAIMPRGSEGSKVPPPLFLASGMCLLSSGPSAVSGLRA